MLGPLVLKPSFTREPHFRSNAPGESCFTFACVRCASPVAIAHAELIEAVGAEERVLGAKGAEAARQHFGIGIVGKGHSGGWPSMLTVGCLRCGTHYLVYADVHEVRNSVHHVTVQGVTELTSKSDRV